MKRTRALFGKLLLTCLLLALAPAQQSALASSPEESRFEIAYWDFQNGNCPAAVGGFTYLLGYALFENRARLYLSLCQYHLNNYPLATEHFALVEPEALSEEELRIYENFLKPRLAPFLPTIKERQYTIEPFFALTNHSPTYGKKSSTAIGLNGRVKARKWEAVVGIERLAQDYANTASSYKQHQFYGLYGAWLHRYLELSASLTYQLSNNPALQGTNIWGVQATFGPVPFITINGELYLSRYPNLLRDSRSQEARALNVFEGVLGGSARFLNKDELEAWGQITAFVQGSDYDQATSLNGNAALRKTPYRVEEKARARWKKWLGSVSLWEGTEILGVRDRGMLVFNSIAEKHTGGWNIDLGYHFSESAGALLARATEYYNSGQDVQSVTYKATLWLNF